MDYVSWLSAWPCRGAPTSPRAARIERSGSELANTLQRAALGSTGAIIDTADVREAPPPHPEPAERPVLGRALDEAGRNRTRAAEPVGLPSSLTTGPRAPLSTILC